MKTRTVKILLSLSTFLVILGASALAFADAAGSAETQVAVATKGSNAWIAIAAGLGIGIAALGGALGQGPPGRGRGGPFVDGGPDDRVLAGRHLEKDLIGISVTEGIAGTVKVPGGADVFGRHIDFDGTEGLLGGGQVVVAASAQGNQDGQDHSRGQNRAQETPVW